MPEYAELHSTAHQFADAARGYTFNAVEVDTQWSLPCSLPAESQRAIQLAAPSPSLGT